MIIIWYKTYEASFTVQSKAVSGVIFLSEGAVQMTILIARFIVAIVEIYSKIKENRGGEKA